MIKNCSAIILSAGISQRMQKHKALLLFDKKNNRTFIEQIVKIYSDFGCEQILIISNPLNNTQIQQLQLKAQIIVNKDYNKGRFSSIMLAAKNTEKNNFAYIQNIDNPFITTQILEKIYEKKEKNKYISPRYNGKGGHPILISPQIITQIQNQNHKNLNFREFLKLFERKNVIINDKHILTNINTQKEYNYYFK
jgi:CTP:molybdopterin cytidylyltransferase MocA